MKLNLDGPGVFLVVIGDGSGITRRNVMLPLTANDSVPIQGSLCIADETIRA